MSDGHVPNPGHFSVAWSEEDQEYVGTHSGYPSLSWLDPLPEEALRGIRAQVRDHRVDVLRASKTKKRVKCQVIVSTLPCCTEAFEAGAEQYEQHKAEQFTGTCFLCKGELAHGTSHSPDPEAYSDKYADQCEYCEEDYSYCKHDPVWAEEEAARVKADLRYLEALWDM